MYVRRIRLTNYGPLQELDLTLPIDDERPRPTILVGENGAGKSLLLSHIVNGLLLAKDAAFPDSPELEQGKVYKVRSPLYITVGQEFSFAQVDFDSGRSTRELMLRQAKQEYSEPPPGIARTEAQALYDKTPPHETDSFIHDFVDRNDVERLLQDNCALYFPPNRFEDPAWLNTENLKAQAEHTDARRFKGQSARSLIDYSTLRANQNWLFDLVYDWSVFERAEFPLPLGNSNTDAKPPTVPVSLGYSGPARRLYDSVLGVVRTIVAPNRPVRLGIGRRHHRVVSLLEGSHATVPNIFQLSSGETFLLNLFLSIVRDFDLAGAQFTGLQDIRGVVIVDEIDLHLHTVHQYEILPKLMQVFPRVQFIATSHSPLFAPGLDRAFGQRGFGLYSLPAGRELDPEDFSEFGEAYLAFRRTRRHSNEIRSAVQSLQRPAVFAEGMTDGMYLAKAALQGYVWARSDSGAMSSPPRWK